MTRYSEEATAHKFEGLLAAANDKIDGLQAELDSAVEVAFNRGAIYWAESNYPNHRCHRKESER